MSRNYTIVRCIALGLTGLLLAGGPALAKKKAPIYPVTEVLMLEDTAHIAVMPPKMSIETYPGQTRNYKEDKADVTLWIQNVVAGALRDKGFSVTVTVVEPDTDAGRLLSVADKFVRKRQTPEADPGLLLSLLDGEARTVALVQYLEIKLGPRGWWNGNTGALGVGMSNSDLRVVLLDCDSGEILWRSELYLRDLPEIGHARFAAAIEGMFDNLTNGGMDR